MPLNPGDLLANHYRIEAEIGRGAYGRVYRARDIKLDRAVAIKELARHVDDLGSSVFSDYVRRFEREARVQAGFNHPNIVHVYELIQEDSDRLYLAMELVDGESLRDTLARRGPLPVDEAVRITADILAGLAAVHDDPRDIVHRDIKPSNVLLTKGGQAKLADFGLAQVGDESQRSGAGQPHPGTPAYMSPEQETTSAYLYPASDLFSVGCLLFEMLTGVPYKRAQRERKTLRELRPDAPEWLAELTMRALAKDPVDRPANAAALGQLVGQGQRIEADKRMAAERAQQEARRLAEAEALRKATKDARTSSLHLLLRRLRWVLGSAAMLILILVVWHPWTQDMGPAPIASKRATPPTVTTTLPTPSHADLTMTRTLTPSSTSGAAASAMPTPTATPSATRSITPSQPNAATSSATPTVTHSPEPTDTLIPSATPGPRFTVKSTTVNVRSGPGTNYPVVGSLKQGENYEITGRNEAGDWWQLSFTNQPGWVYSALVQTDVDTRRVPVASNIPPTPTLMPIPTQIPPEELQGEWRGTTSQGGTVSFRVVPTHQCSRPGTNRAGTVQPCPTNIDGFYMTYTISDPACASVASDEARGLAEDVAPYIYNRVVGEQTFQTGAYYLSLEGKLESRTVMSGYLRGFPGRLCEGFSIAWTASKQ